MKYVFSFISGGVVALILFFSITSVIKLFNKGDGELYTNHALQQLPEVDKESAHKTDIDNTDSPNSNDTHAVAEKNNPSLEDTTKSVSEAVDQPASTPGMKSNSPSLNTSDPNDDGKDTHNNPSQELTREEKMIQTMFEVSGMTKEQFANADIFISDSGDPLPGLPIIHQRLSQSVRGTPQHWQALQDMIQLYENSPVQTFRDIGSALRPKDADGNPITTYEAYRKHIGSKE